MAAKLNYIQFICALTIIQAQKSGFPVPPETRLSNDILTGLLRLV